MKEHENRSKWPVWAEETIVIEEPNPEWQVKGEEEKKQLLVLLEPFAVHDIAHIGSTSIPSLPAKPIIDLMAKVKDFSRTDEMVAILSEHDWNYVPPSLDQREWRKYFVKVRNNKRVAHLHVVQEGNERWDEHLHFRNILRNNPILVEEYAALKKRLAHDFKDDREAYTEAKSEFIQTVLKR